MKQRTNRDRQAEDGTIWFNQPVQPLPPLDAEDAREALGELASAAQEQDALQLAQLCAGESPLSTFLGSVLSLSPFLKSAFLRRPQILEALFTQSLFDRLVKIEAEILEPVEGETESRLMTRLRRLKGEAHALIGLADLARTQDTQATIHQLSSLADACLRAAVRYLLRDAHTSGKLKLPDPDKPEENSGWILLGMGKLGARELNFSSDIDLIVLFDPAAPAITEPDEAGELFMRLTRRLVRILHDRTGDGYVFRTDLRLRPDPGSTPLAISVDAALSYYEARGQNWERAAMIKARPVAGDEQAGTRFLGELRPYVWRKYMDYAAIADVHSIKRQIHAHRGHGDVAVRGHNVKLGRGGIREIEFFVQTQQLIAGGRFPELRGRETVAMLDMLADQNWITADAAATLQRLYWYLRDVEHRIQIVADEQSHVLPEDDEGFSRIARLMGCEQDEAFAADFRAALHAVEQHYAALFETAPKLSDKVGNLVFTGDVDDPDTLHTLTGLGFERPSDMIRLIRGWHFGRYRATRSAEARERLTELTPALLQAFGETRRADDAAIRFDAFLSGLPAGIQLFSLLQNNPSLLRLLVTIMGAAPRLAETVTRSPHVFDGLLDPSLLSELPNRDYLSGRLTTFLEGAISFEEALDRLRIFAAEQRFLIGVRLLTGSIDAPRAGRTFSDLADLTIGHAFSAVEAEMAQKHGRIPGARAVILGMGKLGSRELTAGSDVDLILIYDHDEKADWSDGYKPLEPTRYFARLTQRLIAAVSAPTSKGILYDLDLRLRPSGNKGPVATHLDAFRKYQQHDAWTWEHMALTRARPISGDTTLASELQEDIVAIIATSRNAAEVKAAATEMRDLLEQEKPATDRWDLKLVPGGVIDLEFIAQVASLIGAVQDDTERETGTAAVLAHIDPVFADAGDVDTLVAAHQLYTAVMQVIRLCVVGTFDKTDMPPALSDILLRATDTPEMSVLDALLVETQTNVRAIFDRLLRS
ncbi:bifunctional [glutamine synthetase] adenylyltransferase/[glutamine synthetase]-adenylyl-L-tyrosine phosphorylase [Tianweitania sp. BSSL-BM11]|uniref:Bifunctional glutamine synthetase adenylyltransferase/adenylyl-removing enzyme n=1 Tax=Tianweitania aestuarii TaxID=2814886 RepID=A0ABS5RUJ0_9HYPH|nr:bifunctional [glutamine synthetase] adenylyltransferase/[glutamine synthetase]-adenylyl-L-tyrosine phosphorylase [Tianweitania aestuarii]MBS9719909.1 bifunctional [glutamine synthetase] adenylyltransferase/[glutamine synthetase]-adenylyl-L-tyrosine phosphorylase [Tianweitania aestuarii]